MRVTEIFKSIDGEGKRSGLPTTFIRLAGCNLRCSYCDSSYAFDKSSARVMTADEIIEEVSDLKISSITLTGGEPLVHPGVDTLLIKLNDCKTFDVNVETNGSVDPSKYHNLESVWFTVDYKCSSSGETSKMNPKAFQTLRCKDVLKFVVGNDEDMEDALKVIETYHPNCQIYFSPVYGYDPKNIVKFLMDNELYHCKVQIQLHKIIWPEDMRGV